MERILIIGGNAAGMTAASRARRLDPRLEITVLERSPFISYSTCGIPYLLAGEVASEDLVRFTPATLAEERNIRAYTTVEVENVLPAQRRVISRSTDTGETVTWAFDRLLLATGVNPRTPDIPGTDLANVFSIATLDDALRHRPALDSSEKVVIVGGGYVGLEMAESLRKGGKKVTIFQRSERVLPSIDADMARIIEYELARHGVDVRTSSAVEALVGENGRLTGVKARGTLGMYPAEAALLDTGVVPNSKIAVEAGIRVGATGGIAVTDHMETNFPGVFAAGNCAEAHCLLRRRPVLHHLGTIAAKQGRVAGENLAGRRSRFRGTVGTTILKVFDLAVGRTGLSSIEARDERIPTVSARIEVLDRAPYYPDARKIWLKLIADRESRRLVGAQAVGYGDVAKRIDVAAAAITSSLTLDEVAELDLSYTPPYGSLWDPLHVAAQAVLRQF